jgi:thiamine kinase-like enzyme
MWRRSKRWAREAAKVLALVDEFCATSKGRAATAKALADTPLRNQKQFSPFMDFEMEDRIHSVKLGTAVSSLRNTLLAIAAIDFPRLLAEMDAFKRFIRRWEKLHGMSRRVLAHGDTQYSNLLLIKEGAMQLDSAGKGMPRDRSRERGGDEDRSPTGPNPMSSSRPRSRHVAPYERLIVIDFEYCSPNPRAYDIANAFHEWRFDYHHATDCWSPYTLAYPTRDERRRWLRAYVEQGRLIRMRGKAPKTAFDTLGQSSPLVSGGGGAGMPPEDLKLPPAVVSKEPFDRSVHPPLSRGSSAETVGTPSPGFGPQASLTSPAMRAVLDGASASPVLTARTSLASLEASMEREIERLEREVEVFSPACHASWALWGITFAKENIELIIGSILDEDEDGNATIEGIPDDVVLGSAESFDNLRYSLSRVELFREELNKLGIVASPP